MNEFLDLVPVNYLLYGITLFIIVITSIVLFTNTKLLKTNLITSLDEIIGYPKCSINKKELTSKIIEYIENRVSSSARPIKGSKVILIILKMKFTQIFITEIILILYGKLRE
ncbi:MAG: hypothetical protein ACRCX2_36390 [Paraclostridium sp.]